MGSVLDLVHRLAATPSFSSEARHEFHHDMMLDLCCMEFAKVSCCFLGYIYIYIFLEMPVVRDAGVRQICSCSCSKMASPRSFILHDILYYIVLLPQ